MVFCTLVDILTRSTISFKKTQKQKQEKIFTNLKVLRCNCNPYILLIILVVTKTSSIFKKLADAYARFVNTEIWYHCTVSYFNYFIGLASGLFLMIQCIKDCSIYKSNRKYSGCHQCPQWSYKFPGCYHICPMKCELVSYIC